MKNTADFLDALRVKLNLPSDGKLADHLGMHRQHISRYRTLGHTFDDEMCIRVAEILEVKPAFVMACMHYQRAKNPKVKDAWQYLGGLAAALALVAILPAINLSGDSFNMAFAGLAAESGGVGCILCKMMPGALSALWPLLLTLALLAFRHFPRHTPRPKKPRN